MAAKLKCPKCGTMLKKQGDDCKLANGEYRELNMQIQCLVCDYIGLIEEWEE